MNQTKDFENTKRRDLLIEIEKKFQKIWDDEKIFEVNSPLDNEVKPEKFFSNIPFPYMNGLLHVGHGFTISKVEFMCGFERMNGKKVLFPFGFHCTGMPIKAAADLIKREIELFGPDFNSEINSEKEKEEIIENKDQLDAENRVKTRSKVMMKKELNKYQYQILLSMGIPLKKIKEFSDPETWIRYFPGLAHRDIKDFGCRVDWRRSMITTDLNKYFDKFVQWQMKKLKEKNKIKFGERLTIYSEVDKQPCLDHDRRSGEGVCPKEVLAIKFLVKTFSDKTISFFKSKGFTTQGKRFYLIGVTLRPETLYGVSNCFVSPEMDYGCFPINDTDYYITSLFSFKNMFYQKKFSHPKVNINPNFFISGSCLIGSLLSFDFSYFKEFYVLPMTTIIDSKGSGIVACVTSDSPDDYIFIKDLSLKPDYYKINIDWVEKKIIPVLETESYGDKAAEYLVNLLKIKSPKDTVQLANAKSLAYKDSFYNGKMLVGDYKGELIQDAKKKIKNDLISMGYAFFYHEPENTVISRSGDRCIVFLDNQWYIDYGEEKWKKLAEECLDNLNTYSKEVRNAFEGVLDWLKNWALTRNFGLGSRLPWDQKYLIELLSDSTIYMAYYTICHFLHSDFFGLEKGKFDIKPEQLTYDVFEYIFNEKKNIKTDIPLEYLDEMKREFMYFYPFDARVSGKDLISNHLTFSIYTHSTIFSKKHWPKSFRINGHLLMNNEKMSKSKGNFLTLHDCLKKYGADASRIAFADAGDSIEDANFDPSTANSAILKISTLKDWCEEMLASSTNLRSGPKDNYFDILFENEMNRLIQQTYDHYKLTNYKAALKSGFYEFLSARDYYRDSVGPSQGMHIDLVRMYIQNQALLIAPISPHFSEYLFRDLLGHSLSIHNTPFPKISAPVRSSLTFTLSYIRSLSKLIREAEQKILKKPKSFFNLDSNVLLSFYYSASYLPWQKKCIDILSYLREKNSLDDTAYIKKSVANDITRSMPFINMLKQKIINNDLSIDLDHMLTFSEYDVINSALSVLKTSTHSLKIHSVDFIQIFHSSDNSLTIAKKIPSLDLVSLPFPKKLLDSCYPASPIVYFSNI